MPDHRRLGASVVKYLDHFTHVPADDTTRNPSEWKWVSDTATDSVTLPISVTGGVLQIACGAVDNNETYIQLGSATSATNAPWIIGGAAGIANSKPLYFGARVKAPRTLTAAWFVGLAGEGASRSQLPD